MAFWCWYSATFAMLSVHRQPLVLCCPAALTQDSALAADWLCVVHHLVTVSSVSCCKGEASDSAPMAARPGKLQDFGRNLCAWVSVMLGICKYIYTNVSNQCFLIYDLMLNTLAE